jgi:homoserine kinase
MIGSASAPASSGNLGPGFDALALALSLRCGATAEPADEMTITEHGTTEPLDADDMIHRAAFLAAGRPMHITLDNQVPRTRGLGSSSAVTAAVAGAALKAGVMPGGRARVFEIVTELEGFADNAAAAVFGGFVAVSGSGVQRLHLHESLLPVVGIPHEHLKTGESRAVLPEQVSHGLASRTLGRLVFLIEGLREGNAETLSHASGDELQELPRAPLSPITGDLMEAARAAGAVHVCRSGAGPTALAFATSETRGRVIGAMAGVLGTKGEVLALSVDTDGLM